MAQSDGGLLEVAIAGGGVAALEALLALRDTAGDRVAPTLIAPQKDFVYRPLSVGEPFALGDARRVPLAEAARDHGAQLREDTLASVDAEAHVARLGSGEELSYGALLVAVGARRVPAFEQVISFRGQEDSEAGYRLIPDPGGGHVGPGAVPLPPRLARSLPPSPPAPLA